MKAVTICPQCCYIIDIEFKKVYTNENDQLYSYYL